MTSSVFVTGANGFIGRHLCQRLERRGFTVTRAVRRTAACSAANRSVATGDLAACERLAALLAGHEVVVHLAGRAHVLKETAPNPYSAFEQANVIATARLAQAAVVAGVRRFVFVSSIGVFGDRATGPLNESNAPAPRGPYAESKLRAERVLTEIGGRTSLETVIVRPPLVYGPHCSGNMARLVRLVASGIPLPLGGFTDKRSFIGVDNLCALIESVIRHPAAAGETFVAADGEDVSLPQLIHYLADGLGVHARLFRVPVLMLRLAASLIGQRATLAKLTAPLRVDITKARELLGWSAEVSVAEGLRATGRSFIAAEMC
ncbi:MAG: NAD-dependent epimerase/dehydratase family protein [Burkholderiaceae bacterium]|nr:NAD-dependent epimerase/dehydratase family protein [Burkholderiaceae bacterium]MCX7900922.1 NAD-dependent epimerase/dehydratase family protein [Burkholderiaceae bacterium]